MKIDTLLTSAALLAAAISSFPPLAATANADYAAEHGKNGRFLFDKETFGGNGRTCEFCHSKKTGTFSIKEAQERFAKDPSDPLFRALDSDNGDDGSFTRMLTTGTVKIDVPLAPNIKLVDNPSATKVTIFRATPTTRNVTTLQQLLMWDGRESNSDLQHQASSAIHQHTQNVLEPTPEQLDKIAEFERTDDRFFSSKLLKRFAQGGPPPVLPPGTTRSEKRGRQFLNPDRQCGVCHSGPMLDMSSEFDQLSTPGSRFHAAGAGLQLGPLDQAFDADGNLLLEATSPNANQTFEFTSPDGSKTVVVGPDLGQAIVTGDPNHAFNFKITTLWGIKDTAPYFHDNSARTLEEVMDHYNRLFQFINDQGPELFPLLSERDKADLVAYLKLL